MTRWMRHMRTTQERRQYAGSHDDDGHLLRPRAKRAPWNLPNVYDDIWRKFHRTWKAFRKTRWKP